MDRLAICGLCVYEQVRETPFSRLLEQTEHGTPEWRLVSETDPLHSISPHFTHHSARSLMQETVVVCDSLGKEREECRQMCERILEYLQQNDPTGAKDLLNGWWEGAQVQGIRRLR